MTKRVVGVTGPQGFVATHLRNRLAADGDVEVRLIPRSAWSDALELDRLVSGCDAIVHLAAVNRGSDEEVRTINILLAKKLVAALDRTNSAPHVIFSSSTQRENDSPYGQAKREAERILSDWATRAKAALTTLIIPNVYGAGCRPYYNSVVATFCHQLTHGEQPEVYEDRTVEFIWVSDLVDEIVASMTCNASDMKVRRIEGGATLRVSELLARLETFRKDFFQRKVVPDLSTPLDASLYSTFLSHLDLDDHRHVPEVKADDRGELYEIIKLASGGQVFFSTTKPGVIRGNHYHTRKVEWFCVLKGEAVIRLRPIHGADIKEFRVSGDRPTFISIPVLHTHHIENVGATELLTMFWCNEIYDQTDADTFYENVA